MSLTELDKTMFMAMLVFSRGSKESFVSQDKILMKFPRRKRKLVRLSLAKLTKDGFLIRSNEDTKFKFTDTGLESASMVLSQGAKLWYLK